MFADQLRLALLIVWLAVTVALLPVLAAPFVLSEDEVFHLAPVCQARARGGECIACGLTTAFVRISQGRFDAAVRAHKLAIPLYAALVWNECIAACFAAGLLGDRRIRIVVRRPLPAEELSCKS